MRKYLNETLVTIALVFAFFLAIGVFWICFMLSAISGKSPEFFARSMFGIQVYNIEQSTLEEFS